MVKSIIISRLAGIGDTLMLTPLLSGIKRLHLEVELIVVTNKHTVPLTKRMPFVDKALCFEKSLRAEWNFIGEVFRRDVVFCVDTSYRISVLYALAGVKERFGFANKRGFWLTKNLEYEEWINLTSRMFMR